MFDYTPSDKYSSEYTFGLCGINIKSDEFATDIRRDLRLLLALGDSVESAVEQILNFATAQLNKMAENGAYDAEYYSQMLYIYLAFYLEASGYYHKKVFDKAIDIIDNGNILYPFIDAIEYEKTANRDLRIHWRIYAKKTQAKYSLLSPKTKV